MANRQIIMTIDRRGAVSIEAEGFQGTSCVDATKGFEEALVATSVTSEPKPEMYGSDSSQEAVGQTLF